MPGFPRLNALQKRFRKPRRTDFAAGNSIVRSAKSIHLTASLLMLGAGLMLCLAEDLDNNVARWVFAACCIFIGSADVFGYYSNDLFRLAFQFAFTFGTFSILFGGMLLFAPERMQEVLPWFVGMYVILDGLQKVQISQECRKFGVRKWPFILGTSLLVVVLGVLSILHPGEFPAQNLWMGIAVSANGAENFWTTMYTVRVRTGSRTFDTEEK